VAIAGGVATINQYLRGGHIDELRTHVAPVILGAGERLFDGVSARVLELVSARGASLVTHITYGFVRALPGRSPVIYSAAYGTTPTTSAPHGRIGGHRL
jgi:dihydrofolate reductase